MTYYSEIIEGIKETHVKNDVFNSNSIVSEMRNNRAKSKAHEILKTLAIYDGRNRTGDRYVRNVFDCCMLYYLDKFGTENLDKAIEKFFIWTYRERLVKSAVQLASVDNLAIDTNSFFRIIREAIDTKEIFHKALEGTGEMKIKKLEPIKEMFVDLNYWTGK